MDSKIIRACLLVFVSALLFSACGSDKGMLSWADYQEWIHDESNQLKKVKQVNKINISALYLPADYLGFRDLLSSKAVIDSAGYQQAKSNYQCGLTFRILIEPEENGINLLYHKVGSEGAYKARMNALSFSGDQYISMSVGSSIYPPVLVNYEGYNELLNRVIFTAVFQPKEYSCGAFQEDLAEVTLTFEDPFWSTGVNNFTYGTSILTNVPQINMN